jgi:hypothetical protein
MTLPIKKDYALAARERMDLRAHRANFPILSPEMQKALGLKQRAMEKLHGAGVTYCGKCGREGTIYRSYINLERIAKCSNCGCMHIPGADLESLVKQIISPEDYQPVFRLDGD